MLNNRWGGGALQLYDDENAPSFNTYCNLIVNGDNVHIDTDYTYFRATWDGNDGYTGEEINNRDFTIVVASYAHITYGQEFPVINVYDINGNVIASCGSYGKGGGGDSVYVEEKSGLELYGNMDDLLMVVPDEYVIYGTLSNYEHLSESDIENFMYEYENVKQIEDEDHIVRQFFFLDIDSSINIPDTFAYAKLYFHQSHSNVEVLVNGNPMEVIHEESVLYYTKLTEFGSITILSD